MSRTLSPEEIAALHAHIRRSEFPHLQPLLGAFLGGYIKRILPDVNFKYQFGGLRRFLELYAPELVRWRGRRGLDDVYEIFTGGNDSDIASLDPWQEIQPEPLLEFWTLASNPSVPGCFGYISSTGKLYFGTDHPKPKDDMRIFQKLSVGDYKSIGKEFLETNRLTNDSELAAILTQEHFNTLWVLALKRGGLLRQWEIFRMNEVIRIFEERLVGVGVDPQKAEYWGSILKSSRAIRINKEKSEFTEHAKLPRSVASSMESIERQTARLAVERMSDDELRKINIPLHVVIELLPELQKHRG